jgi:hypothetical protein
VTNETTTPNTEDRFFTPQDESEILVVCSTPEAADLFFTLVDEDDLPFKEVAKPPCRFRFVETLDSEDAVTDFVVELRQN